MKCCTVFFVTLVVLLLSACDDNDLLTLSNPVLTSPPTLTITKSGTGIGRISVLPSDATCDFNCPGPLSISFAVGTIVEIHVEAQEGSILTGWSGDCTGGSPVCVVVMNRSRQATVSFSQAAP